MRSKRKEQSSQKILDFKAEASQILPSLRAINENAGNWEETQSALVRTIRRMGSDASDENIVSAYVTPTLRNLNLISGDGRELKLTPDGIQCLQAFEEQGETGFLKRLGLQLLKVDRASGSILNYLLEKHSSPANSFTVESLRAELYGMGRDEALTGTRVGSWIAFLKYVGLVVSSGKKYYASKSQYDALSKGERSYSEEIFLSALHKRYEDLKKYGRGSPYVPIPRLRESVCDDLGISSFTFDDLLKRSINLLSGYRVVPVTPMRRKAGGIFLGKKYYYFLAVYPTERS